MTPRFPPQGLCVLAVILLCAGCNSGNNGGDSGAEVRGSGIVITEERDVTGFDAIRLEGIGLVTVTQGESESVTIKAEDNIMPLLTTELDGTTLRIGVKEDSSIKSIMEIEYIIEVRELTSLIVSGTGNANATGIEGESLDVILQGTGQIAVSGHVESLDLAISGTGNFDGSELATSETKADLSGTGSAVVNVKDQLDATLTGFGSIEYIGDPTVDENVTGIGSVHAR